MEKMNEFITIPGYGLLKIDRIIFEAAYPILFVCTNEEKELFLCVCCQNNGKGKKWLITKTSSDTMVKMLKDEMPIRDAFLENPDCRITVNRYDGKTDICIDNSEDWSEDSIYLPKKGEYLEADPDEFCEEIAHYQNKKTISYSENYRDMVRLEGEVQSDAELVTDDFSFMVSDVNGRMVSAKFMLMQTLKISEQIQLQLDMIQKAALEYWANFNFEPIQNYALKEAEKESVELNENGTAGFFEAA